VLSPRFRAHRLALYLANSRADTYRGALAAWPQPPLVDRDWQEAETGAVNLDRYDEFPWAEAMMAVDQGGHLPDDILTKTDRASMAFGLEVRVPLLDHRLVEFSWRLAPQLKWGDSEIVGKRILRVLLARSLPKDMIENGLWRAACRLAARSLASLGGSNPCTRRPVPRRCSRSSGRHHGVDKLLCDRRRFPTGVDCGSVATVARGLA
jgi:hypothetical protein